MERETRAFWFYACCYLGLLAASATPSPLYVVYQDRWDFPTTMVTVVFAIYAVTLLASLIALGGTSDRFGRPATTGAGMALLALSTLGFLLAEDVGWLLVARALQGVATGVTIGCISAALVDESGQRQRLSAAANATLPSVGLVLGAVASGVAVRLTDQATTLVFAVQLVVVVLLGAGAWVLGGRRLQRQTQGWRMTPVHVPPRARPEFVRVLFPMTAAWSQVGVMLALAGNLLEEELGVTDRFVAGLVIAASSGAAAVGSVAWGRTSVPRVAALGAAVLCAGSLLDVVALVLGSTSLFVLGITMAGFGVGSTMSSVMQRIAPIPAPDERGGVFAALNVVGYAALAVSALATGVVADVAGLGPTSIATCSVVAALAAVAAVDAARRPSVPVGDRSGSAGRTREAHR